LKRSRTRAGRDTIAVPQASNGTEVSVNAKPGPDTQPASTLPKTAEEWKATLSPEQYAILREHGTERAGTSPLNKEKRAGMFRCAGCGQELFASDTKFDSGTGWPSFDQALPGAVTRTVDRSYGMTRTEVNCSRCGGHLGHVFSDGPATTGERYCMNGCALSFDPKG
jgi:peptide-methionine (R)-S-oxide reductase